MHVYLCVLLTINGEISVANAPVSAGIMRPFKYKKTISIYLKFKWTKTLAVLNIDASVKCGICATSVRKYSQTAEKNEMRKTDNALVGEQK